MRPGRGASPTRLGPRLPAGAPAALRPRARGAPASRGATTSGAGPRRPSRGSRAQRSSSVRARPRPSRAGGPSTGRAYPGGSRSPRLTEWNSTLGSLSNRRVRTLLVSLGAALAWLSPVPLSSSDLAVGPELALTPTGEAVVVWDREVGAVCATAPENPACVHIVETVSRTPDSPWRPAAE